MKIQEENSNRISMWFLRILLLIISVSTLTYFFPREGNKGYSFEEGRPWSYSLLTAPFDIPIYKTEEQKQAERDSILSDFRPIFKIDPNIASQMTDAFDQELQKFQHPAINASQRNKYIEALQEIYLGGIIAADSYNAISSGTIPGLRILENNVAKNKAFKELNSPKTAYEKILSTFTDNYSQHILQSSNLNKYLVPNILYDSITTGKIRDEYLQNIALSDGMVQAGERIIDRGEIVTPEIYRILTSYQILLDKHNRNDKKQGQFMLAGQFIVFTCILIFLYIFIAFFRPRYWNNGRALILIMLLITLIAAAAFFASTRRFHGIYLIPITIVPIVVITFFDSRTAMYVHLITTIICSFASPEPMQFFFLQLAAGMAVIDSLNNLSKRSQLFRSSVIVFVVYAVTYAGYILFTEGDIAKVSTTTLIYLGINSATLLFSYLLIYIFERLFGFLSSVTLVELSDINSPLLQRLSEEAPGTFQHAMQVSNLAAAAANHVRANAQLVRTGALYHDIGKLSNPSFFTENQSGAESPHKNLALEESARIIISHVEEGIKMAEKNGLPPQVQEFIATHHGHGKAKYFYNTYCNQHPGEPVDEALFTYPGRNPQSKETGIMMMADAVEAASRSLKEYNRQSITELVNRIIDSQIADGLLKETPLSFRDVETIKETFIEKLMTINHTRIAYPTLNKQ